MRTSLDIVRIPVLDDNYVWLMREPQSGSVGVVDPAVAGPVLAEAARRRWKITHILNTHHHGESRSEEKTRLGVARSRQRANAALDKNTR